MNTKTPSAIHSASTRVDSKGNLRCVYASLARPAVFAVLSTYRLAYRLAANTFCVLLSYQSVNTFFGGVRAWRLHLATMTHHILAAAIPECRIDCFAFRLVRARACEFKSGMSVLVLEPLIDPQSACVQLDKLIGPPRKDVEAAVRDEHCGVQEGEFGASDEELISPNYQVRFTPRQEYKFVMEPAFGTTLSAGKDQTTGDALPDRDHVVLKDLLAQAVELMRDAFREMKLPEAAITQELFDELRFTIVELGSLRMYTGLQLGLVI